MGGRQAGRGGGEGGLGGKKTRKVCVEGCYQTSSSPQKVITDIIAISSEARPVPLGTPF